MLKEKFKLIFYDIIAITLPLIFINIIPDDKIKTYIVSSFFMLALINIYFENKGG